MSRFGKRVVLFHGDIAGSDGTAGAARETDGFLTVILAGSDSGYSYATAVIETASGGARDIAGEITWAYSAQQDFKKSESVSVPVKKGESFDVKWNDQRNAGKIKAKVQWIPYLE